MSLHIQIWRDILVLNGFADKYFPTEDRFVNDEHDFDVNFWINVSTSWFTLSFCSWIYFMMSLTKRKECLYSQLFCSAFSAFGLKTHRYSVSLHIQSECAKMRTRTTPNTDIFHAVWINYFSKKGLCLTGSRLPFYTEVLAIRIKN